MFFSGHLRAKEVLADVQDGRRIGYLPLVVEIEVYYKSTPIFGRQTAKIQIASLKKHLTPCNFLTPKYSEKIAELKVRYPLLSFVDCVVIQTALEYQGKVLTTDTPMTKVDLLSFEKLEY